MGLEKLEVENFKSYAGHHTIGPFDKFTCVVGPNGSGKSNIMDAIAFAFGVTSSTLRSSTSVNLINKTQNQASVKIFINGHTFRRHITSSGKSTYFYNGKLVPYELYTKELENLNLNLKLKNFMVFQGDIHEMANKKPKELCEYFEVLSGSIRFKKEYDEIQNLLTGFPTPLYPCSHFLYPFSHPLIPMFPFLIPIVPFSYTHVPISYTHFPTFLYPCSHFLYPFSHFLIPMFPFLIPIEKIGKILIMAPKKK